MNLKTTMKKYGRNLMLMSSNEHKEYLLKIKKEKRFIKTIQIIIVLSFFIIWQLLAHFNIINTFLFSSPENIIKTINNLLNNNLFEHIYVTFYETAVSFFIASIIGFLVASLLWLNKTIAKIVDPFLTILNSLPKVALGPLIIIWVGASTNSIIVMSLMISLILCIINIYNSFISTEKEYITLMKSFKASKKQILIKTIIPANKYNIFNAFKINISMSLIGVIMGELLVSKKGLGYLIMYGGEVFNINLIITSVFILGIMSYLIYIVVVKIGTIWLKEK
jgi:NitT/TauT family transport system permease protein